MDKDVFCLNKFRFSAADIAVRLAGASLFVVVVRFVKGLVGVFVVVGEGRLVIGVLRNVLLVIELTGFGSTLLANLDELMLERRLVPDEFEVVED